MSNPFNNYQTIMFDLDGTLIDSAAALVASLNDVIYPLFKNHVPYESAKRLAGIGSRYLLRHAFEYFNTPYSEQDIENLVPNFMEAYEQRMLDDDSTFELTHELLKELCDRKKTLLLVTNKPRRFTPIIIKHLGWDQYFRGIFCPEDVSNRKPSGKHLIEALELSRCNKSDSLMVGDSIIDYQAAQEADIDIMMVGFYGQSLSEFPQANFFIHSYADVLNKDD